MALVVLDRRSLVNRTVYSSKIFVDFLYLNRLKKVQGKKKEAAARDTLERESRQAAEGNTLSSIHYRLAPIGERDVNTQHVFLIST